MTAQEMFLTKGWRLSNHNNNFYYTKKIGDILYDIVFDLGNKTYCIFANKNNNCVLNVYEHQAVSKQMKEFGWIE